MIQTEHIKGIPIEDVAERLGMDIVRHKALCPWHDDHHPSLHFYRNNCHCFSCSKGGDNIALVMQTMGVNFKEACRWLAREFDIYIGDDERGTDSYGCRPTSRQPLTEVSKKPQQQCSADVEYLNSLIQLNGLTSEARHFLFEERLLDSDVIGWCGVKSTAAPLPDRKNGKYPVFDANSLLIPYYDAAGRLITVQSRALSKNPDCRFKFASGSHGCAYNLNILSQVTEGEPLLITEGPSDCWTAMTMGLLAVAMPSATIVDKNVKELLADRNIHMFPDQDENGRKLYEKLHSLLPQLVCHQLPPGAKDLSEWYLNERHRGLTAREAGDLIRRAIGGTSVNVLMKGGNVNDNIKAIQKDI